MRPTLAAPPAPPPPRRRVTLASIKRGVQRVPRRILVYGVKGVGKTSLVAAAPAALILDADKGSDLIDVARQGDIETFDDVLDAIRALHDQDEFRTLGVDSIDQIERLIWSAVCSEANVTNIELVGGGYGKGYNFALDKWRILLAELERLQRAKGLDVYLVGHAQVKTSKDPAAPEDYDRYILKADARAAALLSEWVSGMYFANFETSVKRDSRKRIRGVTTGARFLYTKPCAAYDAKDRYGLPDVLALDYAELDAAIRAGAPATADDLVAEIRRKAALAPADVAGRALAAAEAAAADARMLARINEHLNAYIPAGDAEPQGD